MENKNIIELAKRKFIKKYSLKAFVCILLSIAFVLITLPYMEVLTNSVERVSYDELIQSVNDDNREHFYQVELDLENSYEFETVYVDGDENVETYYVAFFDSNDAFIVAEIPAEIYEDESITTYTGTFKQLDDEVTASIRDDLMKYDVDEAYLDEMLSSEAFSVEDSKLNAIMMCAFAIVAIVFALYFIVKLIAIISNSKLSPIQKGIAKIQDDPYVFDTIEHTEVDLNHPSFAINNKYAILVGDKSFHVIPVKDIIWVYENIVKKRAYFLITVSKQHALMINGATMSCSASMKKDQVERAMNTLLRRLPHISFGYDENIKKLYKYNRSALIEAVEQNRSRYNSDSEQQ